MPNNSTLIKHIIAQGKKHGVDMKTISIGAGSDANALAAKGFSIPVLGLGYRNAHMTSEWLDLNVYNQTADIVRDIVLNYKK